MEGRSGQTIVPGIRDKPIFSRFVCYEFTANICNLTKCALWSLMLSLSVLSIMVMLTRLTVLAFQTIWSLCTKMFKCNNKTWEWWLNLNTLLMSGRMQPVSLARICYNTSQRINKDTKFRYYLPAVCGQNIECHNGKFIQQLTDVFLRSRRRDAATS